MITLPHLALLLAAAASLASASVVTSNSGGNFELLILHNNDMHARFEQTSQLSGACTTADREAGKCYGGFPRVAYVVKEARRAAASGEGPPVLYLNAGDTYTGTAWFTIYKWKVAAEFLNALKPDAVSLGSNEFAQSSAKLSPLVNNIESSILATNIILNSEEKYKLKKSLIFDVEGVKVGVIGYLTLETNVIDFTSSVEYIDEVLALSEEVKNLKEQNIDMIIALGHANVDKVIEIATEVDGIDLVINGYKNVYLWNGTTIEDSGIGNENHLIVKQASGKTVQIVQSHSYNNYLGKIIVKFNDGYKITEFQIGQVSLDLSIPQDSEALQVIKTYSEDIERIRQEVIGSTAVVLDGDSCKWDECNLGNLITDSIMYYYAVRFQGERWTDAPVAIIQSSAITASIAPEKRPADVTMGNLLSALQRESNLVTVTMNGTVLTQVLEHSVANYRRTNPSGQFLQYSGIRVTYDLAKESGSRLVDAVVRCWSCSVPEFYSIDDWREYTLIMPLSLANGEQGFSMLVGLPRRNFAYDEVSCAQAYIAQRSPVYPEVSGRIILLNVDSVPDSAASLNSLFALVFGILSFMIGHNLIYTM